MTDFVSDLEAELLKAAHRRRRRPLAPRFALGPALVLAVALAAFAIVARSGSPDSERPAAKPRPPVAAGLPVAVAPTPCGDVATDQVSERMVSDIALLRRPRVATDLVDGRNLPIRAYDPVGTRRVGALAVVPVTGIGTCDPPERIDPDPGAPRGATAADGDASIALTGEGACLLYRQAVARCFRLDEIRAGKAFALVEEARGSRLIGLVTDGPTRVILGHRGAAAAIEVQENTVDALFYGLESSARVSLELDRRTAQVLVLNQSGSKGRAEIEAGNLRAGLKLDVEAQESEQARELTVVTSTSAKSNGLARRTAQLLGTPRIELAPEGASLRETTPGVVVALGRDRMR